MLVKKRKLLIEDEPKKKVMKSILKIWNYITK